MKPDTLVAGLLVATALRASEYCQPAKQRLFNPVFAQRFLPPLVRLLLLPGIRHILTGVMARAAIGGMGMLLCRTRYIDDAMRSLMHSASGMLTSFFIPDGFGYNRHATFIDTISSLRGQKPQE